MANRFTYENTNPQVLKGKLAALEIKPYTFAGTFGMTTDRMDKLLSGKASIPPWVMVALELLTLDGAMMLARRKRRQIVSDAYHPGIPYPHLNGWRDTTPDSLPHDCLGE